MASCQTTRWVSTSPYVKLTVTENTSASDGDSAVLSWTLQYISDSAASTSVAKTYTVKINGETVKDSTFLIGGKTGTHTVASGTHTVAKGTSAQSVAFGVTFHFGLTWSGVYKGALSASGSISVAAKTSYAIQYNANGGSGAPSSQTKWYGTALTLSSTKPTRTGYKFSKWNTAAGGGGTSYNAGASYTANAAATLYAQWTANTYTVSYNANGGSGAPASQIKTYGVTLKLQTTTPTKTNYRFVGWSTSASATTATYAAGANFATNANTTLYAVWELAYTKPRITNFTVSRGEFVTTPDGGEFVMSDEAVSALVSLQWVCDKEVSRIDVEWLSTLGDTSSERIYASGTNGTVDRYLVANNKLNPEYTYTFTVTVTDSGGSSSATVISSGAAFTIDAKAGGDGVSFGKPAELDGVADFNYKVLSRHNSVLVNDKSFCGTDADGTEYSALIPVTASGNTSLGHGLYKAGKGNTHIYGNAVQFYTNEGVYLNGNDLYMDNLRYIYGYATDGAVKQAFQAQNQNNNTIVGYGNYDEKSGGTHIYGHDLLFGISNIATPGTFRPYLRQGMSVSMSIRTAGYVTNAMTEVHFTIPLSRPIVGAPTVTVARGNGFILRQDNKYTHGCTATTHITPTKYSATVDLDIGIIIIATFAATTNATNNAPVGIYWNGTITFS